MSNKDVFEKYSLSLTLGRPVNVEGVVNVHSPTIGEIEELGEEFYEKLLVSILFDKETMEHLKDTKESNFEIVYANCVHNEGYR